MVRHARSAESDLGWDGHLLLVYGGDDDRDARLAGWVKRGLTFHEKVVYCDTEHLSTPESLLPRLLTHGVDAEAAYESGQLETLRTHEFFGGGVLERITLTALDEGYRAVRVSSETTTMRTIVSDDVYITLEDKIDELCFEQPLSVLCTFDSRRAAPSVEEVTTIHYDGVREIGLETSDTGDGLLIVGEVDHANAPVFRAAVAAAADSAGDTLVLDVSKLTFLGVAGARGLIDGTESYRNKGFKLVLSGPTEHVSKTIQRLGLDLVPGVEVSVRS